MSTDAFGIWCKINDAEREAHATDVDWPTWRDRVQWKRADDITEREVYRGSTTLDGYEISEPLGFRCRDTWCDQPYRIVWTSDEHRVVLTFCEGDLSYEVAPDAAAHQRAVRAAAQFYARLKS